MSTSTHGSASHFSKVARSQGRLMYRNAVQYKGIWLAPNSQAFQLHTEKKFKELDQHMKEVDERDRKILEESK